MSHIPLSEKIKVMQGALEGKTVYYSGGPFLNKKIIDENPIWNWGYYDYSLDPNEEPKGKNFCKNCKYHLSYTRCGSNPVKNKTPIEIQYTYSNPNKKNERNNCSEYKEKIIVTIFKTLLTIKKNLSIIKH